LSNVRFRSLTIASLLALSTVSMAINPDAAGIQGKSKPIETKENKNRKATRAKKGGMGVELSGETTTNFYVFKFSKENRHQNDGKGRGTHMAVEDSRINIEAFGKAMESLGGLEYSFLIGFSGNTEPGTNPIQENRLKLKGRWGTVIAGDHRGVTDFMAAGTFVFSGGTGGILGNYSNVYNETTGVVRKDDLSFVAKDMTKLTYVTPRVMGLQVGYSFTPDGTHKGEQKLKSHTRRDGDLMFAANNIHEVGVNFKKDIANATSLFLSATGIFAKPRDNKAGIPNTVDVRYYPYSRHNVQAYALGAVLKYKGFSFGGEYLDNGKSGQMRVLRKADAGKVYTVGVGYETGPYAFSLSYLHSKRRLGTDTATGTDYGTITADVVGLTGDIEVAKGFGIYGEVIGVTNKASKNVATVHTWNRNVNGYGTTTVGTNRGHVLITGAKMKF
jgi:hypothetical protein